MLIASLVAPLLHVVGIDFTPRHIDLITADYDFDSVRFHAEAAHFFLPVDERCEAVLVVYVVYHDDSIGVFVKLLPNQTVIIVTTQVEEVYRDRLPLDCQLLDAIVYTDCRDVALDESTLAVALNEAAFADFLVANGRDFEADLIDSRHVSEVACRHLSCILSTRSSACCS